MKICKVLGPVVSTMKNTSYKGKILLAVQPVDETGHAIGADFLAVDTIRAGDGDTVLVLTEGNGARQILKEEKPPIRSVIVGIVDSVGISEHKA